MGGCQVTRAGAGSVKVERSRVTSRGQLGIVLFVERSYAALLARGRPTVTYSNPPHILAGLAGHPPCLAALSFLWQSPLGGRLFLPSQLLHMRWPYVC